MVAGKVEIEKSFGTFSSVRRNCRIAILLNSFLLTLVPPANSFRWALVTSPSFSLFYLCLLPLLPCNHLGHTDMAKLVSLIYSLTPLLIQDFLSCSQTEHLELLTRILFTQTLFAPCQNSHNQHMAPSSGHLLGHPTFYTVSMHSSTIGRIFVDSAYFTCTESTVPNACY